jgi:endonuclease/exonuclease/phosphatase family metal-dependent hydrolase
VGEFFVASRYPIKDVYDPPALDGGWDAGFIRVTVEAPFGPIDVYNAHPVSPRRGFEAMRDAEQPLAGGGTGRLTRNAELRARQVAALAAHARAAVNPVVIAGDTNLPGLSPLLREQLGDWQDGFAQVGRGFGYTFPAHRWLPWMRIDRVLAGRQLRFVSFSVGQRRGSDHLCVIAELTPR